MTEDQAIVILQAGWKDFKIRKAAWESREAKKACNDWICPTGSSPVECIERGLYERLRRCEALVHVGTTEADEVIGKRRMESARREQERKQTSYQVLARDFYNGDFVQLVVAVLIGFNFLVNVIESCDPVSAQESPAKDFYLALEFIFNGLFTIELCLNLFAHWFFLFWCNPWCIFDFIVVVTAVISMISDDIPGIGVLRLFRAFRVFQLFKKLPSLKMILVGVFSSLPGVANAFVLLGLIMSI